MPPKEAEPTGGIAPVTAPAAAGEPTPKPTGVGGPEDPYSNGTIEAEATARKTENEEREARRLAAREAARLTYHTCGNLDCSVMRLPPWLPRPPERLQEEFRGDRQSLGHLFPSSRRIVLQEDGWPMTPIETGNGPLLFSQAPAFFYGLTANGRRILLKGYPHEWLASGEGAPSCTRAANICHVCNAPAIVSLTLTMREARQPAMALLGQGPLKGRELQCLRGQRQDGSGLPYRVPQQDALRLFARSLMREVGYLEGGSGGGAAKIGSEEVQKNVAEFVEAMVPTDGADGEGLETRWPSPPPSPTKGAKGAKAAAALEDKSTKGGKKDEKQPPATTTAVATTTEENKEHPSRMSNEEITTEMEEIKSQIEKLQPQALDQRRTVMTLQLATEWRVERARLLKGLCRLLQSACELKGKRKVLAASGRGADKDEHDPKRWPARLEEDEPAAKAERAQMLRAVAGSFLKGEHMMIEPEFVLTAATADEEKAQRDAWWAQKLPADVLKLCEHIAGAAASGGLELLAKEWRPQKSDFFKEPPSWLTMDDSKLAGGAKWFALAPK